MKNEPIPPEASTKSTCNLPELPEPQTGNIEYKLKLTNPSEAKLEHLVTQLKWRIGEGFGKAIYKIGVLDNGILTGIPIKDMLESIMTLKKMAERLSATATVISHRALENGFQIAEVEVRTIVKDPGTEIRVAVLGHTGAGKSTLVGVLSSGVLDNGRGKIRQNVLRHLHEIKTGRTSSVCLENLSISADGEPIVIDGNANFGAAPDSNSFKDIAKLITLIDLPGHRKYTKTTLQGIFGYAPNYAMFVLSSTSSFLNVYSETLKVISLMGLPLFLVVTKTDVKAFNLTMKGDLEILLTQCGYSKKPYVIENEDDIPKIELHTKIPVFLISNVTGDGIRILTQYLSLLEVNKESEETITNNQIEFHINNSFKFDSIGQIVIGKLEKGIMREDTPVKIGPLPDGNFTSTCVKTLHRHGRSCREVRPREIAALCLHPPVQCLRNGMALVSFNMAITNKVCLSFEAALTTLSHSSILYHDAAGTVYIGNKRQMATVTKIMDKSGIGPGETGAVVIKFKTFPEYVNVGDAVYFRGKEIRCFGRVLKTFPFKPSNV